MTYKVLVLGAKYLKAPKGYSPEEYYAEDMVEVGRAKTMDGAVAKLVKKLGRMVYGFTAKPGKPGSGLHQTLFTTEKDGCIEEWL